MNTQDRTWEIASPIQANGATHEGKSAYVLGSKREDNPYKKARLQFPTGFRDTSDNRLSALRDLECQWDSGYSIAQRTIE